MRTEATNFHLRITPAEAEYILKEYEASGFIMCKEYGQDNNEDPDAWTGLEPEDLDEDGKLDEEWQTLEIWFQGTEEEIDEQKKWWNLYLDLFTAKQVLELAKNDLIGYVSLLRDAEKGFRSDSQLMADALNAGMLESGDATILLINNVLE